MPNPKIYGEKNSLVMWPLSYLTLSSILRFDEIPSRELEGRHSEPNASSRDVEVSTTVDPSSRASLRPSLLPSLLSTPPHTGLPEEYDTGLQR